MSSVFADAPVMPVVNGPFVPPPAPPAGTPVNNDVTTTTTTTTVTDQLNHSEQFQAWLKNNGNGPVIRAPQAMNTPPPPPIRVVNQGPHPLPYEESREVMRNLAPSPAVPPPPESEAAFGAMLQQNMPMTPEQIVRLKQAVDSTQRAAAIPANIPPKPVSTTLMINLAPGATPPAVRLAQGYVTSLVFVDATGAPWPIAAYDIGDPKSTTIQWDGKSNVLLVQGMSPYGDSDLVIRMVGLTTPITIELVSGQRVVDYRVDLHIAGIGPNSKDIPIGTGLPNSANPVLLDVLEGVAPGGSKQLSVRGGDCQAWLLGDKMYLRTRLTVLSPGWVGRMVSPDGMIAYEIQKSASVLVSQYGNPIELKFEGF
ncbi:hypothetical protein AYO45_04535 [Gammaproteobacteria bacterium SCGC AG-212-F23]|nr:hypothetical protein AYO45_04535 [Gammaproteobacteria bacterium SCGC AG-212-F23]